MPLFLPFHKLYLFCNPFLKDTYIWLQDFITHLQALHTVYLSETRAESFIKG